MPVSKSSKILELYDQLYDTAARFNATDDKDWNVLLNFNQYAAKLFLISVASHFEYRIMAFLETWIKYHSKNDAIVSFMRKQALARRYHTLFDWEKHNANRFLSLFGDDFKKSIIGELQKKNWDASSGPISNFVELGNLRNQLVHGNFMEFEMSNTLEDLKVKYESALKFMEFLEEIFSSNKKS